MIRHLLRVAVFALCMIGFTVTAFAGPMDDLLISSIRNNNISMAKTALSNGANVNYRPNTYSTTALVIAVKSGNPELVQFLLNNGADPNLASLSGNYLQTPLNIAVIIDNFKISNQLINAGADVNATTEQDYPPLIQAINNRCNFQMVSLLIAKNANVNIEKDGYTPLMAAANYSYGWERLNYKQSKLMTAKLLLKSGADPTARNYRNNQTALQYAIDSNFNEMVNLLLPISPKG